GHAAWLRSVPDGRLSRLDEGVVSTCAGGGEDPRCTNSTGTTGRSRKRSGAAPHGNGPGIPEEMHGMNVEMHHKIAATHLQRQAYLYVRQSTLRQVLENTESTKRQYALRERAVALGWPPDRIVVIDSDLGQSGADSDRVGFQKLVAAVGLGEVGVVLGLEVSRPARSSGDWHRP